MWTQDVTFRKFCNQGYTKIYHQHTHNSLITILYCNTSLTWPQTEQHHDLSLEMTLQCSSRVMASTAGPCRRPCPVVGCRRNRCGRLEQRNDCQALVVVHPPLMRICWFQSHHGCPDPSCQIHGLQGPAGCCHWPHATESKKEEMSCAMCMNHKHRSDGEPRFNITVSRYVGFHYKYKSLLVIFIMGIPILIGRYLCNWDGSVVINHLTHWGTVAEPFSQISTWYEDLNDQSLWFKILWNLQYFFLTRVSLMRPGSMLLALRLFFPTACQPSSLWLGVPNPWGGPRCRPPPRCFCCMLNCSTIMDFWASSCCASLWIWSIVFGLLSSRRGTQLF